MPSKGLPIGRCPVCDSSHINAPLETAAVKVLLCRNCRHSWADHKMEKSLRKDYHLQYDRDFFLDALKHTRIRQSKEILRHLIEQTGGKPDSILDFGAGMGWFLKSCRDEGIPNLVGADFSELSLQTLKSYSIHGVKSPDLHQQDIDFQLFAKSLPFRPKVLCLLDVLEHFPQLELAPHFRHLISVLSPELQYVVIKTPRAEGILYRTAKRLSQMGMSGPFHQLYQVGTFPPHFHYFSHSSLSHFHKNQNLEILKIFKDPEFEANELTNRVQALSRLPSFISTSIGFGVREFSTRFGLQDSMTIISKLQT